MKHISKFDIQCTNPIELNQRIADTFNSIIDFCIKLECESDRFKDCITSIVTDYIKLCDDKILEVQSYLKHNLTTTIREMVEAGELDEAILEAFDNLNTKVNEHTAAIAELRAITQANATEIATNKAAISSNAAALSNLVATVNDNTSAITDINNRMPYYIYNEETEELTLVNVPTRQ